MEESLDFIPKASYIQTGTQDITRIIQEKIPLECEGDFLDVSEENNQTPTNPVKFLNLFWFFDPAAENRNRTKETPLDLVTFELNLNYGNLRINGYENASECFHNQALFISRDLLRVNAAVYPTGIFNIRHLNNGEGFRPIEQLFTKYDPQKESWHDELTRPFFQKHDDQVKMTLMRGDVNYFYIFKDRQYRLFNYALDFILEKGLAIIGTKK